MKHTHNLKNTKTCFCRK